MYFELSIFIQQSPEIVFAFLRDKDTFQQEPDSPVLILEKTTPGPAGVGTRYREVVQMLPFYRGEIRSVVTRFEPTKWLDEEFEGAGMYGHLSYQFIPEDGGTRLIQRETLHARGVLKPFEPLIRLMLASKLTARLTGIKELLEKQPL